MMTHISFVPIFFIAISFVVCVCADSVTVGTAADLIKLFNETTGNTLGTNIEVTADLDFSGHTLPLGVPEDGSKCVPFSGEIQGNGHSIKGFKRTT